MLSHKVYEKEFEKSVGFKQKFIEKIIYYNQIGLDGYRAFVASFSSRRDDLSQWRSYSNDGEGFTIGLSASALWKLAMPAETTLDFGQVGYQEREFKAQAVKAIDEFSDAASENIAEIEEYAGWCEAAVGTLCAFHKHNSFRFEREWRLVRHHTDKKDGDVLV